MKMPIGCLIEKISNLDLNVHFEGKRIIMISLQVQPHLLHRIRKLERKNSRLVCIMKNLDSKLGFWVIQYGILVFQERICVPNDATLKEHILNEAHRSRYIVQPDSMKMYHNLKLGYWWNGMKK